MKVLDVDMVLNQPLEMEILMNGVKQIHQKAEWLVFYEENCLLGYAFNDEWHYEYCLNLETKRDLNFTIYKKDNPSTTFSCKLDLFAWLDKSEYITLENNQELSEIYHLWELISKKEAVCEALKSEVQKARENVMIPILKACHLEEFYDYEINDVILSILEERIAHLKSCNGNCQERQLLEEILTYNSYLGQRQKMLATLKKYLRTNTNKSLDNLKKVGVTYHHGTHLVCHFFCSPRYLFVLSSSPSSAHAMNCAYRQIKKHFF